jgi:hypothetical protein
LEKIASQDGSNQQAMQSITEALKPLLISFSCNSLYLNREWYAIENGDIDYTIKGNELSIRSAANGLLYGLAGNSLPEPAPGKLIFTFKRGTYEDGGAKSITLKKGATSQQVDYGTWRSTDVTLYETSGFCLRFGYDDNFCIRPYTGNSSQWDYHDAGYAGIFKHSGKVTNLSQIKSRPSGVLLYERWIGLSENEGCVIAIQETPQADRKFFRLRLLSYKKDSSGKIESATVEYEKF